jgi:hypothetical protein
MSKKYNNTSADNFLKENGIMTQSNLNVKKCNVTLTTNEYYRFENNPLYVRKGGIRKNAKLAKADMVIKVLKKSNGNYVIIDGHKRFEWYKKNNKNVQFTILGKYTEKKAVVNYVKINGTQQTLSTSKLVDIYSKYKATARSYQWLVNASTISSFTVPSISDILGKRYRVSHREIRLGEFDLTTYKKSELKNIVFIINTALGLKNELNKFSHISHISSFAEAFGKIVQYVPTMVSQGFIKSERTFYNDLIVAVQTYGKSYRNKNTLPNLFDSSTNILSALKVMYQQHTMTKHPIYA